MQDKIRRLQPAARVARAREESAARKLADLQRQIDEHRARLRQLLVFRGEYAEQFESAGREGMSVRRLQDYVAFLRNLDRSIAQSQTHLERLQDDLECKRDAWTRSRGKTSALEGVLDRYRLEQDRQRDRLEQIEIDERAGHRHFDEGTE